jgi:hypothetical protein
VADGLREVHPPEQVVGVGRSEHVLELAKQRRKVLPVERWAAEIAERVAGVDQNLVYEESCECCVGEAYAFPRIGPVVMLRPAPGELV